MNAHTKRLAERLKLNRELAARDAEWRCWHCRHLLPHGWIAILETGAKYCTEDCRVAARERAEASR